MSLTTPMDNNPIVEQIDRDAWEKYGPAIFHCEMTGPEALARHRLAALQSTSGQEPVAWLYERNGGFSYANGRWDASYVTTNGWTEAPLYTRPSPPPATQSGEEARKAAFHAAQLDDKCCAEHCFDAGWDAAQRLTTEARMTEKVAELVIAAREVAFGLPLDLCRHVPEALELMNALDRATGPFAESVPWDDEPSAALRAGDYKGEDSHEG